MLDKEYIQDKNNSVIEIKTVLIPPIKINFTDYVNCPICNIEIDIKDKIINNKSTLKCEDCNHNIIFKIVKC